MALPSLEAVILWLKRRKAVVLIFVFSFIMSGLIVNLLQLLTVPLYFANKRLYRIVNSKLVYLHWCRKYAGDRSAGLQRETVMSLRRRP